jgi:carbonic anhydrase
MGDFFMSDANEIVWDLVDGYDQFKEDLFPLHEQEFLSSIENGQKPGVLMITCSDSRIVLASLFNADPGQIFVVRNVGNIIPSYSQQNSDNNTSVIAAVEYAVNVLGIKDIIIMGHSHCGAIEAIYNDIDLSCMCGLKTWLNSDPTLYEKAQKIKEDKGVSKNQGLELLEKYNIVAQIKHLKTYPIIKKALKNKDLFVHGWFYQLETGTISYYDPNTRSFKSLTKPELSNV